MLQSLVTATPTSGTQLNTLSLLKRQAVHNDYSCRSTSHPNPVVLLHGLGATYYEDINELEAYLQSLDFCTFSLTYGNFPGFPEVGGLENIAVSAPKIASFIQGVQNMTSADKIDLVGHSEGAFQTLYVPKFEGVSGILDKLVAIAPPTHGTSFANLYNASFLLGNASRDLVGFVLDTFGCPACNDLLPDGAAVKRLNDGNPIVQSGNTLTVIASEHDELVTPTTTAWVDESGVTNEYVQQYCEDDPVGHIGEAYDTNVWSLVVNALEDTQGKTFTCSVGLPFKKA